MQDVEVEPESVKEMDQMEQMEDAVAEILTSQHLLDDPQATQKLELLNKDLAAQLNSQHMDHCEEMLDDDEFRDFMRLLYQDSKSSSSPVVEQIITSGNFSEVDGFGVEPGLGIGGLMP